MEVSQQKLFENGFCALCILVLVNWLFQFGQFEHPDLFTYAILILPFSAWLIVTTLVILHVIDKGVNSGETWGGAFVVFGIFWLFAHLATWLFPAEHIFNWTEANHKYTGFILYKVPRFGCELIKEYYNYVGWINFLGSIGIGIWLKKYTTSTRLFD